MKEAHTQSMRELRGSEPWSDSIEKGGVMNENGNTNIVQNVYENFRAGEIKALLNLLSDDIEWQLLEIENVPFAGKRRVMNRWGNSSHLW